MPIGDFSRATQLSIKTLRYYHRVGLLAPADVDDFTGHRRYAADQIPAAQVIKRFRALEMPVDDIRDVLAATDLAERNDLIAAHLSRLEDALARSQEAVASLRELLTPAPGAGEAAIEHRSVPATPAAAVREVIDLADAAAWYQGALGELHATLAAQHLSPDGPAGGIFETALFAHERGAATVFVPCARPLRGLGRVEPVTVPAVELAIVVHAGPLSGADRAYGTLGGYVSRHAIGVDGPVREYYLTGPRDTADESQWRTEIGWPIFRTGAGDASAGS